MKFLVPLTFILLLFGGVLAEIARAEAPEQETYGRLGVGIFNSAKDNVAEVKTVAFGYNEALFNGLRSQYELQGWIDSRRDLGRKCGGAFTGQLGVDVNPGYFYFGTYAGIGLLYPTDSYLGGMIQFVETVSFGVRDNKQKSFGFFYQHVSSAGVFSPNMGRDFTGLKVGVPF